MNGPNRSSALRDKLGATAVFLASGGATRAALTGGYGPFRWDMSNPSTLELRRPGTALRTIDIELALSEIRATQSILVIPDLADDRAFWMYVTAVDAALTSLKLNSDLQTLAASLALARTAFQDQVATLSGWLAVTHAARPNGPRYVNVAARFRRGESVDVIETPQVSVSDVEVSFLLDKLA